MKKRRIGSITPIWNQQRFIRPHFDFISRLDKNLVLLGNEPWNLYKQEHGYPEQADNSEALIRKHFPKTQFHRASFRQGWLADLYNEGLELMQDCDLVLRLDCDMMFLEHDWEMFLYFLQETDFPVYKMNFSKNSINYYITERYDRGLMDAKEFDILAIDPKLRFDVKFIMQTPEGIKEMTREEEKIVPKEWGRNWIDLHSPERSYTIEWDGWMCHHFRGWNKPLSVTADWDKSEDAQKRLEEYGNNLTSFGFREWYSCPVEIQNRMENWKHVLESES